MAIANPIRIVPLRGDALAAPTAAASLTYRGGPLLPSVQVFTLFWGTAWQQDPQAGMVQQINQFFDFVLTSSLIDQLGEYSVAGMTIGHGSRTGAVILSTDPPSTLADTDIQQFIQQEISADAAVPQPTPNSLYFIFLPPAVTSTMNGGASCTNFCGYHSDINGQVFYAVMPYPDCTGCMGSLSVLDALTSTTSHELCEAITDPVPGQGWYDDQNGEIGDICAWQTKKLGAYTVHRVVEQRRPLHLMPAAGPIKHVVIIVKENHGYDNYFGAFPGGAGVTMPHSPNPPPKDPNHRHAAWLTRDTTAPRVQFQQGDIPHYWSYANQFTLCDNYYTDVAGPSTPNHLMLIMADSPLIDNPSRSYRKNPGPPLYDKPSLPAQFDKAGLSWGNYNGYAFEFIKYTAGKKKTWQQFAADATAGKLPSVSWLYAGGTLSEHPADTPAERAAGAGNVTKGSEWTASQVKSIVTAGLWPQVAVFITWDDWGGWWDHVTPPEVEKWTDGTQFRYGGRVGCLVLSPYAWKGHISKALHSHASLVRFCEVNFGLPSLNARTASSDSMKDCFDFGQAPLPPPQ